MKKWVFIFVIVIIVIAWQSVSVYQAAIAQKYSAADVAMKAAEAAYPVKRVNDVTFYHGKDDYHIVDAVLKNGQHVYIWVFDPGHKVVQMLPVSAGYSKAEILNAFREHVAFRKIISARLGMEDGRPVWEITYIDKNGAYVFSYYDFSTGQSLLDPISIQ